MNEGESVTGVDPVQELLMAVSRKNTKVLRFNISGQTVMLSQELAEKQRHSRLCDEEFLSQHWIEELNSFYFDRDPVLFNAVMNCLRYNSLIVPAGYSKRLVENEMKFFGIDGSEVNLALADEEGDDELYTELEEDFLWMEGRLPPPKQPIGGWTNFRYRTWCFMMDPTGPYTSHPKLAVAFATFNILAVTLYLIVFGMSTSMTYRNLIIVNGTTPSCSTKIQCLLLSTVEEWISMTMLVLLIIFVVDTTLKIILCPDHKRYFRSLINILDFVASLCSLVSLILTIPSVGPTDITRAWVYGTLFLRAIQTLRVFKILQVISYTDTKTC
mgnify:CR=1 FL=1